MSGLVMVACFLFFLLCSYWPCQATNCCKATLPRCQTASAVGPDCQATKLSSYQAAKKSSSQAATVARADKQPSCPLAACPPCRPFLVTLHPSCPSCNMHKNVGPILGRSRPGSRPIQTRSRPQPARVRTCDCLVPFLSSSCWFTIHEICNSCQPVPRVLKVKLNPSVNTIAGLSSCFYSRSLRVSMWPLVKPQIHVNISCHILKTWSSSWALETSGFHMGRDTSHWNLTGNFHWL